VGTSRRVGWFRSGGVQTACTRDYTKAGRKGPVGARVFDLSGRRTEWGRTVHDEREVIEALRSPTGKGTGREWVAGLAEKVGRTKR